MRALVDQYCTQVHDAPLTAAAYDPYSGVLATADDNGVVAVRRRGETSPGLVFQPLGRIRGGLAIVRGGALIAVGDREGSVGVYQVRDQAVVFEERRSGPEGRVRAMRGVALNPEGSRLAAIARDGLLRVWDLVSEEREASWTGFGGMSVDFGPYGDRVLALDDEGQPVLVDLRTSESLALDPVRLSCHWAAMSPDGTHVLAAGQGGMATLRVSDGTVVATFATQGGSGVTGVAMSPEGDAVAAITQRSVHLFSFPELDHAQSEKHGVRDPSSAAVWTSSGARVGGADGTLGGAGVASGGVTPVVAVAGYGKVLLGVHDDQLDVWEGRRLEARLALSSPLDAVLVDRDGKRLALLPRDRRLRVLDLATGRTLFKAGQGSVGAARIALGGSVVAAKLRGGGVRWWHIDADRAYELNWPQAMALSGSGTWMAVVTPQGEVRVLDPETAEDALDPPMPLAEVPIVQVAFVNRRPELLVLDEEMVLGHYDLGHSLRMGEPAEGSDVLDFGDVRIDRLWGVSNRAGALAVLRLQERDGTATVLTVDVTDQDVVFEAKGLHPDVQVERETGHLLEPARSGAILERRPDGRELRVYRCLPGEAWVCFGHKGFEQTSPGAPKVLG